jgi:hypothetical protein
MVRDAKDVLGVAPWLSIFPGLMILLTALAFNYLGDGLTDALDPRKRVLRAPPVGRPRARPGVADLGEVKVQ